VSWPIRQVVVDDRQVRRQEAPGLVEALLRRILGIAGVGAHGEAVASAGRNAKPWKTTITRISGCARAAMSACTPPRQKPKTASL
jgi:hypothetical protein